MSVYFITCRDSGLVKIGCAGNAKARLSSLQTSSPLPLVMEAVFDGSFEEEDELHKRFAHCRVRGEWFSLTDEIEALIQSATPASSNVVPIKPNQQSREEIALEELVQRSLREEREAYAEWMRARARFDELFPLELREVRP